MLNLSGVQPEVLAQASEEVLSDDIQQDVFGNLVSSSALLHAVGQLSEALKDEGVLLHAISDHFDTQHVSWFQRFKTKIHQPTKLMVMLYASHLAGQCVSALLKHQGLHSTQHTDVLLASALAATEASIQGFVASWLGGGRCWRAGLKGAASGALFGGVQGQYGQKWSAARVVQQAVAGAVSAHIHGLKPEFGLKRTALVSGLTYIAAKTRAYECAHSSIVPGQLGESPGALGIAGKIGGERINAQQFAMLNDGRSIQDSLALSRFQQDLVRYLEHRYSWKAGERQGALGLFQGASGRVFGYSYSAGGAVDRVVESFAGIHDFLNHPWFYNADGTSHYFLYKNTAMSKRLGAMINLFNVGVALPVGLSALVPTYFYPYIAGGASGRGRTQASA